MGIKGIVCRKGISEKTRQTHDQAMPQEHAGPGQHGHDHHAMMIDDFKKRFWVSLLLSVPVIVISPMVQHILGYALQVARVVSFDAAYREQELLCLTAGVLYQQGIMVSPAIGAALMSLSTVIVAINAQLLRWQIRT